MLTKNSFLTPSKAFGSGFEPYEDPLGPLQPEEYILIPSTTGPKLKNYKILRRGDYYQCNCPSFVYQYETPWDHRTCKHIIKLRGKQREDERTQKAKIKTYGSSGKKPLSAEMPLPPALEATLGPLKSGESQEVEGTGSKTWIVSRRKDYYQCNCPAFRFQRELTWECRTCKHITQVRGERAEKERTGRAKTLRGLNADASPKKRRKSPVKRVKDELSEDESVAPKKRKTASSSSKAMRSVKVKEEPNRIYGKVEDLRSTRRGAVKVKKLRKVKDEVSSSDDDDETPVKPAPMKAKALAMKRAKPKKVVAPMKTVKKATQKGK